MPPQDASARLPWRSHWPAAVLAGLAGVVAVWAHVRLFPALSWNRDEPVYLWHVELLRDGRLTAPDGGHPDAFLPWLSAARDGHMFTQYTLGWPLTLLAADVLTGTPAAALPVGAALAVVGVYALTIELLADRTTAVIAAALLVGSPLLAIQGGVYLSYLFTLGLGLIAGALILSGVRRAQRWRLLLAGGLLGWVFLTRPYDAVLWGAVFAAHVVVTKRPAWGPIARQLSWVAAAGAPFVVAGLAYNAHVTGHATQFPITAADPLDTFGFGTRRLMPGFETTDYTIGTGLRATVKNIGLLPWFLAGSYLTGALALVGLWRVRHTHAAVVLGSIAAVFPLGYLVFWGTHLSSLASRISGPIYFIPLVAPVCILAARVLVDRWSSHRAAAVALLVVIGGITVPLSADRFDVNRDLSVQQRPWGESVDGIVGPALVLVADGSHHLLYTNPFASNSSDLDDRVLFATMAEPTVLDLIGEHPGRAVYLQVPTVPSEELGPREDPYDLDVALVPARVVRGEALTLRLDVDLPDDVRRATVVVSAGGSRFEQAVTADGVVTVHLGSSGSDELALGSVPGAIEIVLRLDGSAGSDRAGDVRAHLWHRVVAGRHEVLVPPAYQRRVAVGDELKWYHQPSSTALGADVVPRSDDD